MTREARITGLPGKWTSPEDWAGKVNRRMLQNDHDNRKEWRKYTDSRLPWYDVTHPKYGAKGDGTVTGGGTDDTAAIQAAIDDAEAAGGGIVYLPSGSYRITNTLTVTVDGIQIIGQGFYPAAGQTIIWVDADVTGISLTGTPHSFRLANFDMQPTTADTSYPAIQIATGSMAWSMENIGIRHSGSGATKSQFDIGVYVESAISASMKNVICVRTVTTGIKIGDGVTNSSACHLDKCYVDTDTGASTRGYLLNKVHSSTLTSCVAEGYSKKGLEMIGCEHCTILTPHLECDSENGQTCLEMNSSTEHCVVISGRYTVKDATGTPIVISGATNCLFLNPDCVVGTKLITVSGASSWNYIFGGDIAPSEVDFGTTQNNFWLAESGEFLWDTEAIDTKWRIGDNNSGIETQLGDTAALLAARAAAGVSVSGTGGSDPFDILGSLILKSKTIANTGIYFYTGNPSTLQGRIESDGGAYLYNLKSGANQAAAGAAANELYHDTDDNTIKIGV